MGGRRDGDFFLGGGGQGCKSFRGGFVRGRLSPCPGVLGRGRGGLCGLDRSAPGGLAGGGVLAPPRPPSPSPGKTGGGKQAGAVPRVAAESLSLTHRRRPHLADPRLLGYGPDLVDKGEGVSELFPAGLENGALGRRQELGHGQPEAPAGRAAPERGDRSEQSPTAKASTSAARSNCVPPQEQGAEGGGRKRVRGEARPCGMCRPRSFLGPSVHAHHGEGLPPLPTPPFVWGARERQLAPENQDAHTKRAQGARRPLFSPWGYGTHTGLRNNAFEPQKQNPLPALRPPQACPTLSFHRIGSQPLRLFSWSVGRTSLSSLLDLADFP